MVLQLSMLQVWQKHEKSWFWFLFSSGELVFALQPLLIYLFWLFVKLSNDSYIYSKIQLSVTTIKCFLAVTSNVKMPPGCPKSHTNTNQNQLALLVISSD